MKKNKGLSAAVHKIQKRLRSLGSPETKYLDVTQTNVLPFQPTWNGNVTSVLSPIVQGLGDASNRIGDKIRLKSVSLKVRMFGNASYTNSPCQQIRVLVLQGKQELGSPPVTTQVFSTTYVGTSLITRASKLWDYKKTYKILLDKTVTMPSAVAAVSSGLPEKNISFFKALNSIVQFNASGGILNGGIYVMAFSDTASSAAFAPTAFEVFFRATYTDM